MDGVGQHNVDLGRLWNQVQGVDPSNIPENIRRALNDRMGVPSVDSPDEEAALKTLVIFMQENTWGGGASTEEQGEAVSAAADGENSMAAHVDLRKSQGEELDDYAKENSVETIVSEFLGSPDVLKKILRNEFAKNADDAAACAGVWQSLKEHGHWRSSASKSFGAAVCDNPKSGKKTHFPSTSLKRRKRINSQNSTLRKAASKVKDKIKTPRNRFNQKRKEKAAADAEAIAQKSIVAVASELWRLQVALPHDAANEAGGAAQEAAEPRTRQDAVAFIQKQPNAADLWIEVAKKFAGFAKYENLKDLFAGDFQADVAMKLVEAECWKVLVQESGDSHFAAKFKNSGAGLLDGKLEAAQPGACAVCDAASHQETLEVARATIIDLRRAQVQLEAQLAEAKLALFEAQNGQNGVPT